MSSKELQFTRVDLVQVGQLDKRVARVLPAVIKGNAPQQQRVIVGDETGTLTCFSVKKGDIDQKFKTLPTGAPVTRVELGGPKGVKDRVFYANGHSIIGVSKKGREFFRFETSLTEVIRGLFIEGNDVYATGDNTFYHFNELKDKDYYLCKDKINDFFCCALTSDAELDSILACNDRVIRVLQGSEVLWDIQTEGSALSVHRFDTETRTSDRSIIYGTENGVVGLIALNNAEYKKIWSLPASTGGVQVLTSADICADGFKDIAVGRDDGTVEVFSFEDRTMQTAPILRYRTNLGESIQAIDHGQVIATKYEDVIVATFSGKVMGLSPDQVNFAFAAPSAEAMEREKMSHGADELKRKIREAEVEVKKLEERVTKEAERIKATTATVTVPDIPVNIKMSLVPAEGCHRLTFEVKTPIDAIALTSDVALEIEEVDRNVCVVSAGKPLSSAEAPSLYLASVRVLQQNTHRIELRVQTIEGPSGTLRAFVLPQMQPATAQVCSVAIRPLSLHERVPSLDHSELQRPMSEVKFTGQFSVAEVQAWVGACFPDVPEKCVGEEVKLCFRSSFTGSVVDVLCRKGEALFRSDSVATLGTLKDAVAREATQRNTRVHVAAQLRDASIPHMLDLINMRLEAHFALHQRVQLHDPLRELQLHEGDLMSFLSEDLADIMRRADEDKKQHVAGKRVLELLFGVILDLYRMKFQLRGKAASSSRETELKAQLARYDLEAVKQFFSQPI